MAFSTSPDLEHPRLVRRAVAELLGDGRAVGRLVGASIRGSRSSRSRRSAKVGATPPRVSACCRSKRRCTSARGRKSARPSSSLASCRYGDLRRRCRLEWLFLRFIDGKAAAGPSASHVRVTRDAIAQGHRTQTERARTPCRRSSTPPHPPATSSERPGPRTGSPRSGTRRRARAARPWRRSPPGSAPPGAPAPSPTFPPARPISRNSSCTTSTSRPARRCPPATCSTSG